MNESGVVVFFSVELARDFCQAAVQRFCSLFVLMTSHRIQTPVTAGLIGVASQLRQ
jgi:hypothetical protein